MGGCSSCGGWFQVNEVLPAAVLSLAASFRWRSINSKTAEWIPEGVNFRFSGTGETADADGSPFEFCVLSLSSFDLLELADFRTASMIRCVTPAPCLALDALPTRLFPTLVDVLEVVLDEEVRGLLRGFRDPSRAARAASFRRSWADSSSVVSVGVSSLGCSLFDCDSSFDTSLTSSSVVRRTSMRPDISFKTFRS